MHCVCLTVCYQYLLKSECWVYHNDHYHPQEDAMQSYSSVKFISAWGWGERVVGWLGGTRGSTGGGGSPAPVCCLWHSEQNRKLFLSYCPSPFPEGCCCWDPARLQAWDKMADTKWQPQQGERGGVCFILVGRDYFFGCPSSSHCLTSGRVTPTQCSEAELSRYLM